MPPLKFVSLICLVGLLDIAQQAHAGVVPQDDVRFKGDGAPCLGMVPDIKQGFVGLTVADLDHRESHEGTDHRPTVTFANIRDVINDRAIDAWRLRQTDFAFVGLSDWTMTFGRGHHGDETTGTTPTMVSQVPVPGTLALVPLALVGLGVGRMRRRQA